MIDRTFRQNLQCPLTCSIDPSSCNSLSKKKAEAKSKGRRGKSSLETDVMKNSKYYTNSSNEFPKIEEWIASKDKFRVVGLGHARLFPLVNHVSCNANLVDYHRENVAPHLGRVLSNHKIPWISIEPTKRLPPGSIDRSNQEEGHDIESLLISTASENTLWWKTAARQILDMYCEGGWLPTDIEVEIYNPHKMTWNESHVLDERNVVSAFNSLRPAIEGEVRSLCRSAWSSIAFHNRSHVGISPGLQKPTMIVFFNQGSQCDFEKLDDYLGKLLKTSETKLFHEIQVGSVIEANTRAKTTAIDLPDNPLNGASIALKSDTENAGTLGGWLTLNNPADFSRIKVGVSCYHLISSPGPENIQKMDMKGLTPSEAQDKSLSIVYPAAMDMEAILKQLNTENSNPNSLGTKEENLKNARRILAKPPMKMNGEWIGF